MNDRRATEEKMECLDRQLQAQFAESDQLEQVIREYLSRLGYE